jgi:hypothetical protein
MTWEVTPWLGFIELNYLPHLCPHKLPKRSIVYQPVQHPFRYVYPQLPSDEWECFWKRVGAVLGRIRS